MIKLHAATFYRKNNDTVVCYQTKEHKVFVFNYIVGDILDIVKNGAGNIDNIIDEIKKKYIVKREDEIEQSVTECVKQLKHYKILIETCLNDYFGGLENKITSSVKEGKLNAVLFELTYRCSEKCRHCYVVQDGENEISLETVKSVLKQLAEMNVTYITFTGGEPFLRKDFMEILRYAYKLGFVIDIFTNGISITDEQFFQVAECCPRYIHFSLYSHLADVHDGITCVKGSFERTCRAIRKFKALGIAVNVKTVIMSENCNDIGNIIELCEQIGATIQVGATISPKNDFDKKPLLMRVKEKENLEYAIRESRDRIEKIEGIINGVRNRDSYICGAGLNGLSINPKGEVYPCNALLIQLGNVKNETVSDIWNNSTALKKWRENKFSQIKGCEKCELIDYCGFCPGTAMTEKGDPFVKYQEACDIANIRKKIAISKKD